MHCSLLIVEDDPDHLDILVSRFSRIGYHVTAAHHSRQALAAATFRPFQVVIVNHMLPKIDGIELTRRLHALRQDVQVVVVTSDSDAVSKARAAGALACLLKPCKQAALEATVEDLFESCVNKTRLPAKPAAPNT